jgi:gamma-glutamylcyclotransferase (GGCT)/AIG2-like uncharacterized protein YtfP
MAEVVRERQQSSSEHRLDMWLLAGRVGVRWQTLSRLCEWEGENGGGVRELPTPAGGVPRCGVMSTRCESGTRGPDTRLATYGTLGPGRPNHGQLNGLSGRWLVGHVRGSLVQAGWGAELGYPGLILDAHGPPVEVDVFESLALPQHWHRLDAFEGPGYRRVAIEVSTAEGDLPASIYVLKGDDSARVDRPG